MSITNQSLPFDKLLEATIVLLKYIKQKNENSQINLEIVTRIIAKSKITTLNAKQFKILEEILKTFDYCQIEWLQNFLNCIPHSTLDEIYGVFNILLRKTVDKLNKTSLKKIIDILLDQYTVKGKAHQLSKNQMIDLILSQNFPLVKSIIQICLTDNLQPNFLDYQARKKRDKEHIIDTKMYKIHYQLFIEKVQLFLKLLLKIEQKSGQFYSMMTTQIIKQIYVTLKKLLESKSSKIKQKVLRIIKSLIQVFGENIKSIQKIDLFFTKSIMSLSKISLMNKIQSKLHYQAIANVNLIFIRILKTNEKVKNSFFEHNIDFMDGTIQAHTDFQIPSEKIQNLISEIRFRQFLKIYPILGNLMNSPWENIREMCIEMIIQFFSSGLIIYSQNYQNKAIEILRPLLLNFIQSSDHFQRLSNFFNILGACKIIGCLLGMSRQFGSKTQMEEIFSKISRYIKPFMNELYSLQDDWHQGINKISKLILQVALSSEQQQILSKKINQWKKTEQMMENSYSAFNLGEQYNFQKNQSSFSVNNFENLQNLLKDASRFEDFNKIQSNSEDLIEIDEELEVEIGYFKAQILQGPNLKTSFFGDKQSYVQKQDEHYFQPNQDKADSFEESKYLTNLDKQKKSQEQPLQFEDLGIIDLDDEQWGQEQNEVKITQRLPLKKIYKLSPNIGGSSKHQRIRSKRYFSHEFQPNDKIIIDELEGGIGHLDRQNIQKLQKVLPPQMRQYSDSFSDKPFSNELNNLKIQSKQEIEEQSFQRIQSSSSSQRITIPKKVKKSAKKRKSSIIK